MPADLTSARVSEIIKPVALTMKVSNPVLVPTKPLTGCDGRGAKGRIAQCPLCPDQPVRVRGRGLSLTDDRVFEKSSALAPDELVPTKPLKGCDDMGAEGRITQCPHRSDHPFRVRGRGPSLADNHVCVPYNQMPEQQVKVKGGDSIHAKSYSYAPITRKGKRMVSGFRFR